MHFYIIYWYGRTTTTRSIISSIVRLMLFTSQTIIPGWCQYIPSAICPIAFQLHYCFGILINQIACPGLFGLTFWNVWTASNLFFLAYVKHATAQHLWPSHTNLLPWYFFGTVPLPNDVRVQVQRQAIPSRLYTATTTSYFLKLYIDIKSILAYYLLYRYLLYIYCIILS